MGKLILHEFSPVIYPRKIWVIKGRGLYIEQKIQDTFRSQHNDSLLLDGWKTARAAVWPVMETSDRAALGVLVWLIDRIDVPVIAHESVHAANAIFKDCGILYDADNDEHYAHLVGFIADCIWQTWTGKFKD